MPGDQIIMTTNGVQSIYYVTGAQVVTPERRLGHQPDPGAHRHAVRLPPAGLDQAPVRRLRQARRDLSTDHTLPVPADVPADETPRPRRHAASGAAALGAGFLVALSLPPWGWWPLAFVGIAILDRLVADRPARSRFARTWLFGLAWLGPGMGWMWYLTAPGYVVAVASYAGYLGLAAAIAPGGRWRRLALPAALTVAETIRFAFPFGGVPLASLGISQAFSPLSQTARLGGVILITWLTFMAGSALSAAWERSWREAVLVGVAPVALILLGVVAPSGHDTGRTLTVAIVQGGGPQGTHATETDPRVVFERHLDATRLIDRAGRPGRLAGERHRRQRRDASPTARSGPRWRPRPPGSTRPSPSASPRTPAIGSPTRR